MKDTDYKTNPFRPAVGRITGKHKCSYLNSAGTLYTTTKAVCFFSTNFFGFEHRQLIVLWHSVLLIENDDDNGIIITATKMMAKLISVGDAESEKVEYFFTIVSDWDTVSNLMKHIHYESTENYDDDILPMEISTPRVHHPEILRQSVTMSLPCETEN
eukprot:14360511-Ditylum_brightwellii.AAC.1